MIIKSMSRKTASFGQLANYMNKGECITDKYESFYNNIFSKNTEGITEEFKNNAKTIHERKNGNMFYHEMISITKSKTISLDDQKKILYKLVKDYVELRAKNNLVYGVMHTDKSDNLHYHLMISSNEIGSEKKHRLSKGNFANIQKEIEKHILNNYPEMEQKIIYNQDKDEKTNKKEYELKKRTGKESDRDCVKRELKEVFESSKSKSDFFNKITDRGFEIYIHGNTVGVTRKETGLNYRLKTLGLLDEFQKISSKIEEMEHRKEEVKSNRNEFVKEKINTGYYRDQEKQSGDKIVKEKEARKEENQPNIDKEEVKKHEKNSISDSDDFEKNSTEKSDQKKDGFFKKFKNSIFGKSKEEKNEAENKKPESDKVKESDRQMEIQRRKEEVSKLRESESDHSKEYSRDR